MTSPVSAIEAIEKAMEGVKKQADRHYCNALNQFEKTPCLGAEFKMKEGLFGRIEHEAHASANKAMGHHFGMYEAIRQLEPLMREVLTLARQAEALQRENAEKDARIAALEAGMRPFSKFAGVVFERNFNSSDPVDTMTATDGAVSTLYARDFFGARALLGGSENAGN